MTRRGIGRFFLFLVIVLAGVAGGSIGRAAHQGRVVKLGAELRVRAAVTPDGVMNVTEDLTIDASSLKNGRGARTVFTPAGTSLDLVGIRDARGGIVPSSIDRTPFR